MPERHLAAEPGALRAAAAQAGHFGFRSGLVEKDQPMRLKPHSRLACGGPFLARRFDVGTILLARQGFLQMSQRESEAGMPVTVASSAESSGIVMSAFSAMRASRNARCGSSLAWHRPLLGLGASFRSPEKTSSA